MSAGQARFEGQVTTFAVLSARRFSEIVEQEKDGASLLSRNLEAIKDVKVRVQVTLGEAELTVAELMALKEKSVVALDRDASQPVDICLDGKVVGCGILVVVGENFGVEITEISNAEG